MTQINLSLKTNIMATGVGNKSLIQADCAKLLEDIKLSETCKSQHFEMKQKVSSQEEKLLHM